tara:strand:- start:224 stop:412 length:189 start_codon:yes stop_codon:yes gene_type:complete
MFLDFVHIDKVGMNSDVFDAIWKNCKTVACHDYYSHLLIDIKLAGIYTKKIDAQHHFLPCLK